MGQETTRLDDTQNRLNATASDASTSDDPDAIEHEIEQTRAEMSGTIDEIQERLNPDRLKAQAREAAHDATIGRVVDAKDQAVEKVQDLATQATDKVRSLTGGNGEESHGDAAGQTNQFTGTARDAGSNIVETIRANPVPAAIAGAGLGWFLTQRSDHNESRSGYMSNSPSTPRSYRGQQMDTRTGYTNWDRRQPEPGHLREYEGDTFMSQVTSTGGDVVGMIQRNPLPAALAGVGLGWFLMRRSSGGNHGEQPYYYRPGERTTYAANYGYAGGQQQGYDTQGYGYQSYGTQGNWQGGQQGYSGQGISQQSSEGESGRMSEMAANVQETAGDAMHRAQDMGSQAVDHVSQFGATAKDQVSHLPHQAQDQFQHLRGTYQQKMQESPLMMGVVAMGVGLAVGMLLPETQKENQVFGEKRDELMDRAQDMAGQAVVNAQEAAQDAVHSAQGLVTEKVTEAVKETVKDATQGSGRSDSQPSATSPYAAVAYWRTTWGGERCPPPQVVRQRVLPLHRLVVADRRVRDANGDVLFQNVALGCQGSRRVAYLFQIRFAATVTLCDRRTRIARRRPLVRSARKEQGHSLHRHDLLRGSCFRVTWVPAGVGP